MEKQLSDAEIKGLSRRKVRSDKGCRHKSPVHGGSRVGQYGMNGKLEREYESLADAVERNEVGATYQGILACCKGKIRKHCNKVWRMDVNGSSVASIDIV